jgi:hypothetical protein
MSLAIQVSETRFFDWHSYSVQPRLQILHLFLSP